MPVVRQTAEFCHMVWLEPLIMLGARQLAEVELAAWGRRYRARLKELGAEEGARDD